VSKLLTCMLIDEQKQLELHQCIPGHSEEISDIHTSEGITDDNMGSPCLK